MRADKDLDDDLERAAAPLKELTEKIIGAAFEVHNELGNGFLEKVYENALVHELRARGMSVITQVPVPVKYKGTSVGVYYADLLVDKQVLCELKAMDSPIPINRVQLWHYLKATGIEVGLLLNFGTPRLEVKRAVNSRK